MAQSSDILVDCRDLTCGYPGRLVLDEVNLQVRPGEFVALLGQNGSGKSTLLKTIAKTIPPLNGQIVVAGDSLDELSHRELAQRLAFVPQEEHLAFAFSASQVAAMGRLPYSQGLFETEEDWEITQSAMAEADCLQFWDRPLLELSGGERQRVLIARALAQKADILILDEPTSHLDVGHQLATISLLRKLTAQGVAVIAALHDLNLTTYADRVLLLASSKIMVDGPVQEVLSGSGLEEAYDVRFDRLRIDDGSLRIWPKMS